MLLNKGRLHKNNDHLPPKPLQTTKACPGYASTSIVVGFAGLASVARAGGGFIFLLPFPSGPHPNRSSNVLVHPGNELFTQFWLIGIIAGLSHLLFHLLDNIGR
jgi:hypothetical protein